MGVDESLARGLTSRFFREVQDRTQELMTRVDSFSFLRESKRLRWIRAAQAFRRENEDVILDSFLSPSTRKPFLLASFLVADEAAEFQDWKERCVKAKTVLFSSTVSLRAPYTLHMLEVSAHAIQRFLQRSSVGFREGEFRFRDLIDEVRPLANWAGFYSWVLMACRLPHGVVAYPIVPSRHGLYLCNAMTRNAGALSVRTFAADRQLRPEQTMLRDRLLESMEWAARVPYFSVPHISGGTVDALAFVFLRHLRRLRSVWQEWSRMIADGEEVSAQKLAPLILERLELHASHTSGLGSESAKATDRSGYECFLAYELLVRSGRIKATARATSSAGG